MNLMSYIFLATTFVIVCSVCASERSGVAIAENVDGNDRTQRFYDSLESKSTRRTIPRFLYNSLIIKHSRDSLGDNKVVDESKVFDVFENKKIGNIVIDRANVFDEGGNKLERLTNKLHLVTKQKAIQRDLFFKPGDAFDAELLINNQQFLRARSYIYETKFTAKLNEMDTTLVDIFIKTHDSWTLSADAALNFGGRSMIELYDANLFGYGNRLSVTTNFNWKNGDYGGNKVEYEVPNIMGSFFNGHFIAGKNFDNTDFGFTVTKEFIKPTDYELGFKYLDSANPYYMLYADSSVRVKARDISAWGGKSFYFDKINSSIYLTGRYSNMYFGQRPEVSGSFNPYFHNAQEALVGLGLYREKFYTTNLIYGYGVKEYMPAGYKAELVGGYRWGEFSSDLYFGANYFAGGFSKIGYLMGGISAGNYYNVPSGKLKQGAVNLEMRYFSNLLISGRSRIRQFVSINYVRGWNRGMGSDELLTFNEQQGMRGFDDYAVGLNRSTLSSETVVFTPLQPLGFRLSFFGFADFGLLGNNVNMFENNFFSTFGVGVRIKNERLVFSTIQLRLGIAIGKAGVLRNEVFNISNGYSMDKYRYLPTRPQSVPYK